MINIKNIDDNECFKLCLVRYLHPLDHNLKKITKAYKYFIKQTDFKGITKLRTFSKFKKSSIGISVFGYKNKEKHPIYVSKTSKVKHIHLLLIEVKDKRHCFCYRF